MSAKPQHANQQHLKVMFTGQQIIPIEIDMCQVITLYDLKAHQSLWIQ